MAESLSQYAPPELFRILQGIPLRDDAGHPLDEAEQGRLFAMANYIYAALDSSSSQWTDKTSASSAFLAATASSEHSSSAPDAHLPAYLRADELVLRGIPDQPLANAIKVALPSVPDVRTRPSRDLPEMGVWSCPDCEHIIDPWNLTLDEAALIATYLGVGLDCGVTVGVNGGRELDGRNHWQFLRSVDCLAWTHYADHLRGECVVLWFPSPVSEYKSSPGLWWDETRLVSRVAYMPVRLEIEAAERQAQYNFRMWKSKKMITLAKRGLHAARFHLTQWRRNTLQARETLVREMFEAKRSIMETGFALVHYMGNERTQAERVRLERERDEYGNMEREWTTRQKRWARMYTGDN